MIDELKLKIIPGYQRFSVAVKKIADRDLLVKK